MAEINVTPAGKLTPAECAEKRKVVGWRSVYTHSGMTYFTIEFEGSDPVSIKANAQREAKLRLAKESRVPLYISFGEKSFTRKDTGGTVVYHELVVTDAAGAEYEPDTSVPANTRLPLTTGGKPKK